MNVVNKTIVIILIIALAVIVAFFLVRPAEALNLVAGWTKFLQDQIYDNRFFTYLVIGAAILLFLLLLLFVLEVRKTRFRIARVHTQGKSDTWLGIQSLAKTLEYRIDELPDVRTVKPRVASRGKDIDVLVDLDVSPKASVVTVTQQVAQICRDVIETQLGLRIHNNVTIHVTQEPYPSGKQAEVTEKTVEVKPSSTNEES